MAEQIDHLQPTGPTPDEEFAGIGGWLIVPAFFCVLSPLAGVVSLIAACSAYSDGLWTEYGEIYSLGVIVVLLGLICGNVYAAILFFGQKSSAPRVIIALTLIGMVASWAFGLVELNSGSELSESETVTELAYVICVVILIRYFMVSRRVKATFVH